MAGICPKCYNKINHLREICSGWQETNVFFSEKRSCIFGKDGEFKGDDNVLEYNCPDCEETLFTNPVEAENFLKEKDELKEIVVEKIKQIKEKEEDVNLSKV